MKTLKFIFSFFILGIIITAVFGYIFYSKYSLEKIINKIELEKNINFEFNERPEWEFFPKIGLYFSGKIQDNFKIFNSESISFSFDQSYKFVPVNFNINTPSFFIKGLKIKSLKLLGNYNFINKNINLKNLNAKIDDGKFDTKGRINLSDNQQIELKGNFNNLYLNQILRHLDLADWQRVELRLSSNNYEISSRLGAISVFLNNLRGNIPINGSLYFVTTEEERFGIAFLQLLVEKLLPDYNKISKSLSQIVNNFSGSPALFQGVLNIKNGILHTSDLSVQNNNNKINLQGTYDIVNDYFDTKLFFIESEKIIVEALISGNLENPSIQIINENKIIDNEEVDNDIKKIFDEGVNALIDKLLNLNE